MEVIPANIRINFSSPGTRMIFLPAAKNCTIGVFIRLDKTPEGDGRTDRQTDRQNLCDYYRGLHCEQCECAVKTVQCYRCFFR